MEKKGKCSQCERELFRKHLSPVISDLVKNKTAFRKVFKNENSKFCKTCKNKWLQLGKLRKNDEVKEFIENMRAVKSKTIHDNFDADIVAAGPSGMQKNVSEVTTASGVQSQLVGNIENKELSGSPDEMKEYTDAKKLRDHWYQKWINGYCSSRTSDQYMKEMAEYARKWKDSEKRMEELKDEYYNKTQK